MQPFVVVFYPNKKPVYLGEIHIRAESTKPEAIPGEVWLRLTSVVADYPNPKLQNLVHSIEIYMPGAEIPTYPQHEVPYHDTTFLMTECPMSGTIRSLVMLISLEKPFQQLCYEETEAQST